MNGQADYAVDYLDALTDALAAAWIDADSVDRRIFTRITFQIDQLLAVDPLAVGEPTSGDATRREWRMTAYNRRIRVCFRVFPQERSVEVSFLSVEPAGR